MLSQFEGQNRPWPTATTRSTLAAVSGSTASIRLQGGTGTGRLSTPAVHACVAARYLSHNAHPTCCPLQPPPLSASMTTIRSSSSSDDEWLITVCDRDFAKVVSGTVCHATSHQLRLSLFSKSALQLSSSYVRFRVKPGFHSNAITCVARIVCVA